MNDDPIKENNPFRMGLDNLTGDDNINSGIEYNDLHNCSNDLSDRGSRLEEIAHAKFAEAQRRNAYKNTYSASSERNKKVVLTKNPKSIITGIIVAYIAFNVIGTVIATIIGSIGMIDSTSNQGTYIPEYSDTLLEDDDNEIINNFDDSLNIPEYTPEVEVTKNNIHISSGKTQDNTLIVKIENKNSIAYYNSTIEVIFYDAENKPIAITDVSVYALDAREVRVQGIYNLPDYERYDIYFSDRYNEETPYAYEIK